MSSTFSAPKWSEEDELRELSRLTPEEREQVYSDLFGQQQQQHYQQQHQQLHLQSLISLVEAIEQLPSQQTFAYLEAMRHHPKQLCDPTQETKLERFLARERGNVQAAADRVCAYWKLRKSLFGGGGPETAAAASSGGGSSMMKLMEDDLRLLQSGVLRFLPNDSQGRRVLFLDATLAHKKHSRESLLKCLFVMFHQAAILGQNEEVTTKTTTTTQSTDVVVVCNYKYYDAAHFDRKGFKRRMEMINHCLPIKVAAMHFCYGNRKSALELVLPSMKQLMGPSLRQRLCLHVGCSQAILTESLAKYGIHYPCTVETTTIDAVPSFVANYQIHQQQEPTEKQRRDWSLEEPQVYRTSAGDDTAGNINNHTSNKHSAAAAATSTATAPTSPTRGHQVLSTAVNQPRSHWNRAA
mmetsp:Transcript_30075/g.49929  ORF Transcript_30075/g.49929 Transcript_30075/m.49929 type:complete len:410 (-) Transcript_30075:81-1310(-)